MTRTRSDQNATVTGTGVEKVVLGNTMTITDATRAEGMTTAALLEITETGVGTDDDDGCANKECQ